MRIPIAIVMLCLPMAAMGEIFSCTSTYGAAVNRDGLFAADIPRQSWVVDTSRGVRASRAGVVDEDYLGECEVVSYQGEVREAWCSAEQGVLTKIHIQINRTNTGPINFLASTFNVYNFSYAGTCTEI